MLFRSTSIVSVAIFLIFLLSAAPSVKSDAELSTETAEPCAAHQTTSASCPIRCFRADPVCGVNGVTYWCGCPEAACEGVKVAKLGILRGRERGQRADDRAGVVAGYSKRSPKTKSNALKSASFFVPFKIRTRLSNLEKCHYGNARKQAASEGTNKGPERAPPQSHHNPLHQNIWRDEDSVMLPGGRHTIPSAESAWLESYL
ncbi:hypothetical protein QQ045_002658 [Rhodiola kirilowii]